MSHSRKDASDDVENVAGRSAPRASESQIAPDDDDDDDNSPIPEVGDGNGNGKCVGGGGGGGGGGEYGGPTPRLEPPAAAAAAGVGTVPWAAATAAAAVVAVAAALGSEVRRQRHLTAPPLVYGQDCESSHSNSRFTTTTATNSGSDSGSIRRRRGPTADGTANARRRGTTATDPAAAAATAAPIAEIFARLRRQPRRNGAPASRSGGGSRTASVATVAPPSVLDRPIRPSLFVGTRGAVSSAAAYLAFGPAAHARHVRFREDLRLPMDGAVVALEWELPAVEEVAATATATATATANTSGSDSSAASPFLSAPSPPRVSSPLTPAARERQMRRGPIAQPVVLILHGLNNHADFGYMRSMQRECCRRGWIAIGLNFRGCGGAGTGAPLAAAATTPRQYTAAYTGDVRGVVQALAVRLARHQQPLFLAGHSLGANLVAKYLGEEGRSGTLPSCVAGGVTLGNPMAIDVGHVSLPVSAAMAAGAKRGLWSQRRSTRAMVAQSPLYRDCVTKAWRAVKMAHFDEAMAPIFCRNAPSYPFAYQIGYENAAEYWKDASSYRQTPFVSVPFLQVVARDDFLVYRPFLRTLGYSLSNPYCMVLETTCGGHLGWHEAPLNGWGILGSSWADTATADFIQAVLEARQDNAARHHQSESTPDALAETGKSSASGNATSTIVDSARREAAVLRSRL